MRNLLIFHLLRSLGIEITPKHLIISILFTIIICCVILFSIHSCVMIHSTAKTQGVLSTDTVLPALDTTVFVEP